MIRVVKLAPKFFKWVILAWVLEWPNEPLFAELTEDRFGIALPGREQFTRVRCYEIVELRLGKFTIEPAQQISNHCARIWVIFGYAYVPAVIHVRCMYM